MRGGYTAVLLPIAGALIGATRAKIVPENRKMARKIVLIAALVAAFIALGTRMETAVQAQTSAADSTVKVNEKKVSEGEAYAKQLSSRPSWRRNFRDWTSTKTASWT